jgi:glycosyltransferase involved in cell wall biosynthesis
MAARGLGTESSVSVVVPVYESAVTLPELVQRIWAVLSARPAAAEIILVNDGSHDGSWQQIEALAGEFSAVRGIDLMRNSGQHNAVLAGVRAARHDVVVTLDDDLQHPPEAIPTLLDALGPDDDVVYGSPRREQHGLWRDFGSRSAKVGVQVGLGWEGAPFVSDFRAFRTCVRDGFPEYSGPAVSFDALLAWTTDARTHVIVDHAPRKVGHSHYGLADLVKYAVEMVTGFSTRPLRLALAVGVSLLTASLVTAGYELVSWVWRDGSPATGFLVALLLCVAGLQFLVLGVLGEYLGRVYLRVLPRPSYVVRREIGLGDDRSAPRREP